MKNKAVRDAAKNYGVKLWELAEALGINDGNLSRKLRHELPDEEQVEIIEIIINIAHEKGGKEVCHPE